MAYCPNCGSRSRPVGQGVYSCPNCFCESEEQIQGGW